MEFKTKKIEITRIFDVYDGPKLPYIDEGHHDGNCKIFFKVDPNRYLEKYLCNHDYQYKLYDEWIITSEITDALRDHPEGCFYKLKDCYNCDDFNGCTVGECYFEKNVYDDNVMTTRVVQFNITKM